MGTYLFWAWDEVQSLGLPPFGKGIMIEVSNLLVLRWINMFPAKFARNTPPTTPELVAASTGSNGFDLYKIAQALFAFGYAINRQLLANQEEPQFRAQLIREVFLAAADFMTLHATAFNAVTVTHDSTAEFTRLNKLYTNERTGGLMPMVQAPPGPDEIRTQADIILDDLVETNMMRALHHVTCLQSPDAPRDSLSNSVELFRRVTGLAPAHLRHQLRGSLSPPDASVVTVEVPPTTIRLQPIAKKFNFPLGTCHRRTNSGPGDPEALQIPLTRLPDDNNNNDEDEVEQSLSQLGQTHGFTPTRGSKHPHAPIGWSNEKTTTSYASQEEDDTS